jgi:hypothetical protein
MTGFAEELGAAFMLQNMVLVYETQVCDKERFRNKSVKQTREAGTVHAWVHIYFNDTFRKLLRYFYFFNLIFGSMTLCTIGLNIDDTQ